MTKHISKNHNHLVDKLALANAILSGITLYPQFFLLLVSEVRTEGFSELSFALIASNSLIWLWYGIHRKTTPLIISSALNVISSIGILVLLTY